MCKSLMTLHILELIKTSLLEVEKRSEKISEPNDFLTSETGVILMDSICMKLSAVGESIKNLDKITNHELLPKYSEVPWKNVMGKRARNILDLIPRMQTITSPNWVKKSRK